VQLPGDTSTPATIASFQAAINRLDGFRNQVAAADSFLSFQSTTLDSAHDLLTRAKELATQGANESYSVEERAQIAEEVYQIREGLVQLANSTYQGEYIWNGSRTDTPPYNASTYTVPATGPNSIRYDFDASLPGATLTQGIAITDSAEVTLNSSASDVWDRAIWGLERLGRALAGFQTLPAPPAAPDGTGAQYVFPADYQNQTQSIRDSLQIIKSAQEGDIQVERVNIGGRQKRLEAAEAVLTRGKESAQEVITNLSEADVAESASSLSLAQTALEASLTITTRILNLTVLDYI
jgi:flagellar hook-associated protein 3 FlgL